MTTIRDEDTLLQWKAGPAVDLSAGYNITENIAAELQSGFAVNSLSKVDGNTGVGSVHLWTIPVMANGIYNYALNDHLQIYGGVGAGVLIGKFDLQPGVSATDCDFGYQAMVGMKYNINDHWQAGVGYTFTGSLDNHWDFQDEGSITTSPTYMHTILLSLTYKF